MNGKPLAEDDWTLLALAAEGKNDAFHEIVLRHSSYVYSFICRMLADEELAKDASQEVFLRLWQKAPNCCKRDAKFTTYLLEIAKRVALEIVRASKRETEMRKRFELESRDLVASAQVESRDMVYELALDELGDGGNWRNEQPLPSLAFHLAVYRRRCAEIEWKQEAPKELRRLPTGSSVFRRYLWLKLWATNSSAPQP